MAIAERMAAARFNRPGFEIVDNFTYVLAGDGDLMEGVSAEASSLAGHLKLGKLIVIYDSNKITIEGSTDITFTESVKDRYAAYGWHVQEIDGHSIADIQKAVAEAQKVKDRPSLIVARTSIAKWAPTKEGSASAHGSPLGEKKSRVSNGPVACQRTRSSMFQRSLGVWQNTCGKKASPERKSGTSCSPAGPRSIQSWQTSGTGGWQGQSLKMLTKCSVSSRLAKRWRPELQVARCSTRWPQDPEPHWRFRRSGTFQ